MPGEITLFDLHHVIQLVMGWEDCHLHDFMIKRQRYALPGPDPFDEAVDESETRMRDVVGPRNKFVYQDFGDSWKHDVLVERVVDDDATSGVVCVDGERACPPEDCGGPWGYTEKLEALSSRDDESSELREWMGGDFDPELFDRNAVNKALRRFFRPSR